MRRRNDDTNSDKRRGTMPVLERRRACGMQDRLPLAELVAEQRARLSLSLAAVARRMHDAADDEGSYSGATRQTIHEIEQGRIPHPDPLRWLAVALELPVKQVADAARRQRMNRRQLLGAAVAVGGAMLLPAKAKALSRSVPAIRRALLAYDELACGLDGNQATPLALSALRRAISHAGRLRQASRYADLGADLPTLLAQVQLAAHETADDERQAAFGLLAEANHLAAGFLKKAAVSDLAWVAVDRASHAAERAELPLLKAASAYRVANLLLEVGYHRDAADIAGKAIDTLEPGVGTAPAAYLSLWGALHLKSAVIAAGRGDQAAAWQHLGEAKAAARRLGRDRNDFWTAFGPTNVALHEVSLAVLLGDAGMALQRARTVKLTSFPRGLLERRSHLLIDVARAHADARQDAMAVRALLQADRVAPEEVLYNRESREVLRALLGREHRIATPELRGLAARSGVLT
jgi:transcriptional regulator with XRE-family HTH domain